jgi:glycogen debranching enzyme
MKKPRFSLVDKNENFLKIIQQSDHQTLAIWAKDCAERVLPYFSNLFPQDLRPTRALETLQSWITTGKFSMATIRRASLDAHAAARNVGKDTPARSAARAAGQAVATAHVPMHALGAANYTAQAVHRATALEEAEEAVKQERAWQYQHLLDLNSDNQPA